MRQKLPVPDNEIKIHNLLKQQSEIFQKSLENSKTGSLILIVTHDFNLPEKCVTISKWLLVLTVLSKVDYDLRCSELITYKLATY